MASCSQTCRAPPPRATLGRPPAPREQQVGREFLEEQAAGYVRHAPAAPRPKPAAVTNPQRQALADFCLVLLNSAEFLYVD